MGMDVYGKAAKSEQGKYFRSNIWSWPTILDAIAATGVLPAEMVEHMAYNDGAGPDEEQSIALADALDAYLDSVIASGSFVSDDSQYAKMGTATIAIEMLGMVKGLIKEGEITSSNPSEATFSADVEFLREFAAFCRDSGGFSVW